MIGSEKEVEYGVVRGREGMVWGVVDYGNMYCMLIAAFSRVPARPALVKRELQSDSRFGLEQAITWGIYRMRNGYKWRGGNLFSSEGQ